MDLLLTCIVEHNYRYTCLYEEWMHKALDKKDYELANKHKAKLDKCLRNSIRCADITSSHMDIIFNKNNEINRSIIFLSIANEWYSNKSIIEDISNVLYYQEGEGVFYKTSEYLMYLLLYNKDAYIESSKYLIYLEKDFDDYHIFPNLVYFECNDDNVHYNTIKNVQYIILDVNDDIEITSNSSLYLTLVLDLCANKIKSTSRYIK